MLNGKCVCPKLNELINEKRKKSLTCPELNDYIYENLGYLGNYTNLPPPRYYQEGADWGNSAWGFGHDLYVTPDDDGDYHLVHAPLPERENEDPPPRKELFTLTEDGCFDRMFDALQNYLKTP